MTILFSRIICEEGKLIPRCELQPNTLLPEKSWDDDTLQASVCCFYLLSVNNNQMS
ncbi:hypothetical protein OIU84_017145 [Salix udensis]|uniref:Uncharacterized protein n=1 Tax=Salix udensis TaxID=889485 RepID=A0AAD6L169_9ROSI|nr:hypothetical protein OIU84_017145 [Salix udensis]